MPGTPIRGESGCQAPPVNTPYYSLVPSFRSACGDDLAVRRLRYLAGSVGGQGEG